jgi:hypothetical protein
MPSFKNRVIVLIEIPVAVATSDADEPGLYFRNSLIFSKSSLIFTTQNPQYFDSATARPPHIKQNFPILHPTKTFLSNKKKDLKGLFTASDRFYSLNEAGQIVPAS